MLEVLKLIAENYGYVLLSACVYVGDYVYVFVFAKPKVCIFDIVCVLVSNFVCLLFLEFSQIKLHLWGGHLWSEGYAAVLLVL